MTREDSIIIVIYYVKYHNSVIPKTTDCEDEKHTMNEENTEAHELWIRALVTSVSATYFI